MTAFRFSAQGVGKWIPQGSSLSNWGIRKQIIKRMENQLEHFNSESWSRQGASHGGGRIRKASKASPGMVVYACDLVPSTWKRGLCSSEASLGYTVKSCFNTKQNKQNNTQTHLGSNFLGCVLASFRSVWPRLELSERREPQLRKFLYKVWLEASK